MLQQLQQLLLMLMLLWLSYNTVAASHSTAHRVVAHLQLPSKLGVFQRESGDGGGGGGGGGAAVLLHVINRSARAYRVQAFVRVNVAGECVLDVCKLKECGP